MNALTKAHRAYSAASAPTRTTRGTEYEVVAQVTHRLRLASAKGPKGFPEMVQALHDNKKLWSIFAIDVADDENSLPKELKARLFYLAEFTHQHTSKILSQRAPVEPLLEINTAILRGLRNGTT